MNEVASADGLFSAVGGGGIILRSTDNGNNWTAATDSPTETTENFFIECLSYLRKHLICRDRRIDEIFRTRVEGRYGAWAKHYSYDDPLIFDLLLIQTGTDAGDSGTIWHTGQVGVG